MLLEIETFSDQEMTIPSFSNWSAWRGFLRKRLSNRPTKEQSGKLINEQ